MSVVIDILDEVTEKTEEKEGDLYSISYDVIDPEPQKYNKITQELDNLGAKKVTLSQWVLRSTIDEVALANKLSISAIDASKDRLIIVKITDHVAINPITELDSL